MTIRAASSSSAYRGVASRSIVAASFGDCRGAALRLARNWPSTAAGRSSIMPGSLGNWSFRGMGRSGGDRGAARELAGS